MNKRTLKSPIEQRRDQVEKLIEKLISPKNQKTAKDYKTEDGLINWKNKKEQKLIELEEELKILTHPETYNEIPLAIAAEELGISLSNIQNILCEGLIRVSYEGIYQVGSRITREELARLIEIGSDELLRIANQELDEIFDDAVKFLHAGDIQKARQFYERLDMNSSCIHPFALAVEAGIFFLEKDYEEILGSLRFIAKRDETTTELAQTLASLKKVMCGLESDEHLGKAIYEQIMAVADGKKVKPFDSTYTSYRNSEYFSQMDENQRHSMFLSSVVFEAIKKYKSLKSIQNSSWGFSESKEEEIEMVIRNAIFTALEAESTYHDSATSKLFVDNFVEFFPKRWTPAEHIILLPKNSSKK